MLVKRPSDIVPSEITPKGVYLRRREFMTGAASLGLIGTMLPERAEAAPLQAAKSPLSTTGENAQLAQGHHHLQQLLRVRHRQGRPGEERGHTHHRAVEGQDRRPGRQTRRLRLRRPRQARGAGGAHLPHALRGGLVDGDPVDRLPALGSAEAGRAAGQRQVRGLRDAGATGRDAGPARRVSAAAVALRGRPAPGRGDAPAHHPGGRPLRRDAAQAERRAHPPRGALEVRLQEHQVDRAHPPLRDRAADLLEGAERPRVRLLSPTSTPRSTIRAGARRRSGASARAACSAGAGPRCCSTATASRSRASTPAWT